MSTRGSLRRRDRGPIAACARDVDVNEGTLGNWVARPRERGRADQERASANETSCTGLRMQRDVLNRSTARWVNEAMNR